MNIVFTTLAMNQTHFFLGLADALVQKGFAIRFIAFHERSARVIQQRGYEVLNTFSAVRSLPDPSLKDPDARLAEISDRFSVSNPTQILSHEKVAFELETSEHLSTKFCNYLEVVEATLHRWTTQQGGDWVVVQETGGFTSLMATFYVAKKLGIPHIFMEPSFFRGRVFFIRDSFAALDLTDNDEAVAS